MNLRELKKIVGKTNACLIWGGALGMVPADSKIIRVEKKLKLDPKKAPSTVEKFGNTSSVSIPLTMVSELKDKLDYRKILLSGFGVGMTWASCILNTGKCLISDLVEY